MSKDVILSHPLARGKRGAEKKKGGMSARLSLLPDNISATSPCDRNTMLDASFVCIIIRQPEYQPNMQDRNDSTARQQRSAVPIACRVGTGIARTFNRTAG